MCFHLSGFSCPGCARQFAPTFQRCPTSNQPSHHTPSLTLLDLIRSNSYNCPYPGCELNGNVHYKLFNLHANAATQNSSFHQAGFPFLPLDAYNAQSAADADEPCELALSESEKRAAVPLPRNQGQGLLLKSVKCASGIPTPQRVSALRVLKTSRGQSGRIGKTVRVANDRSLMTSGRVMKRSSESMRPRLL